MPRRPRPTAEKLRLGETRPSRVNFREPLPPQLAPAMPEAMSEEAKEVWARVIETAAPDLILAADEFGLEAFSDAVVMYRRAMEVLRTTGPVLKGRHSGLVANPMSRVARDWQQVALAWSRELGLSPAARSSLVGRQDSTSGVEAILGPSPRDLVVSGLGADWGVRHLPSSGKPS